jgi:hypothetical protein
LKPDFIVDVAIIWMKLFQLASEMGSTRAPRVVRRALAANISGVMNDIV